MAATHSTGIRETRRTDIFRVYCDCGQSAEIDGATAAAAAAEAHEEGEEL